MADPKAEQKIRDALEVLSTGGNVHASTKTALKRRGMLDERGGLTLRGLHFIGKRKHVPQHMTVPPELLAFAADKSVYLSESYERSLCSCGRACDSDHDDLLEGYLNAQLVLAWWSEIVNCANEWLASNWSTGNDFDAEAEGPRVRNFRQNLLDASIEKAVAVKGSVHYTSSLVESIARALMSGKHSIDLQTSHKCSFSDTPDEADHFGFTGNNQSSDVVLRVWCTVHT